MRRRGVGTYTLTFTDQLRMLLMKTSQYQIVLSADDTKVHLCYPEQQAGEG